MAQFDETIIKAMSGSDIVTKHPDWFGGVTITSKAFRGGFDGAVFKWTSPLEGGRKFAFRLVRMSATGLMTVQGFGAFGTFEGGTEAELSKAILDAQTKAVPELYGNFRLVHAMRFGLGIAKKIVKVSGSHKHLLVQLNARTTYYLP